LHLLLPYLYQNGKEKTDENECKYCGEYIEEDFINCKTCNLPVHFKCLSRFYHGCINIYSDSFEFLCSSDCGISDNFIECKKCSTLHLLECDLEKQNINPQFKYLFKCSICIQQESDDFEEEFGDYIKEMESTFNILGLSELIEKEGKLKYVKNASENPDMSICCSHFVKGKEEEDAKNNLFNILDQSQLKSSITGYYGFTESTKAVCFTELTTKGLIHHTKKYSSFGLAFLKSYILDNGGNPALYVNDSILKGLSVPDKMKPFINKIDLEKYDFHNEREWRVPNDLYFNLDDVIIVYAPVKFHDEIKEKYSQVRMVFDLNILALI